MVSCPEPDCVMCGLELLLGGWRLWRWRWDNWLWICEGPFCSYCWETIRYDQPYTEILYRYEVEWPNYNHFWHYTNVNPWVVLEWFEDAAEALDNVV